MRAGISFDTYDYRPVGGNPDSFESSWQIAKWKFSRWTL